MYEFSTFQFSLESSVSIDHADRIWVASLDGVNILDSKSKIPFPVPILMDGKEMLALKAPSIREDNQGRIWLLAGLPDTGTPILYTLLYDEEKKQFERFDIDLHKEMLGKVKFTEPIYIIESDTNGNLAAITWGTRLALNIVRQDQTILTEENAPILRKVNKDLGEVRDILFDKDNTIWLAGEHLQKINIDRGTYENVELPEDVTMINSIFEDREGSIWLGTYQGILLVDPNQRIQHKYNQSVDEPVYKGETVCLFQTWDNTILTGGWSGGGLFFYDQNLNAIEKFDEFTRIDFSELKAIPPWKIIEDSEKNIWIGAQHGYLFKVDRKNKKILRFQDPAFDSRTIRDMCEDTIGNIWFSNQKASIVRWIKKEGRFVKFNLNEFTDGFLFFYAENRYIWASGGSYLFMIDAVTREVVKKYHDELKSLSKTGIILNKIIESSAEKLVMASSEGLVEFNKLRQSFNLKKVTPGILSAEVIGIDKYLLVLGDGSIVEYNSGTLNYLERGSYYNFNSSVKLKNDVVIFGAGIGMTVVKPKNPQTLKNKTPPPLITSIQVLNKKLNVDSILSNGLNLNYDENHFSVTYSALNFQEREDIDYYYRIGTESGEFINVQHQRTITYAQLPHGKYHIEIFYGLPDGRLSPITSLKVNIRPPIWKQPWFLAIVTIIAFGFILFVYWIRLSKIKALAKVREKISRDLHDDMGSNLSSINILSNVARGSLLKPGTAIKIGDILDKISNLSFQAMESVDEIVWSLDPQHDSFEEIVARMRLLGGEMLENQNINFTFSLEGDPSRCNLSIDRRNDFYMIYKESITNITKYARCKNVYANLSINKDEVTIIVADDGVGFNLNMTSGGNGLQNIRARAKNLKARLTIESEIGKGTRIELSIPVFSKSLN